ncbi:amino acid ABC transporter substrate-binding protein [Enterovibrio sp. ZSDZ35]|uniref:Amino acid ABC transporter substrate-binding protein n=1 Tax=Enterovibrio qingdaonensis TaxID=2899818 RepID=A0ABT5QTF1_9GAMM|nr:amino acid ABC transporter substrate-binding protein [Enterovibrio sp. ZSDZ35]MDD1784258.1 amino acid ABC transporter substrate-binding protein [Enterovibrio sp. ZSDZ35]
MKNLLVATLALATSVTSTAALSQEDIKVGMSGRYFPFTFVKMDKLQGFEIDVWNEIGKRADYDVEFVTANFSGLFGMLEAGHIDTISNQITMTDARKAKYAFSVPYVVDGAQVVIRKGRDDIAGIDDLKGKKVAVNLGSNFEQLLRNYDKAGEINIITYDSGFEQDVALGRTDAFVMDRVSSAQLIKKSGLPLQLAGEPFETIQNAMPFLNTPEKLAIKTKVDKALNEMKADGTLSDISEKWFDSDITQ